ncbi:MAG: helix-turn-helix domain-containing protein [Butyricicoccus sp.]
MPSGVIIVDDDAVMRMSLRMMIDWTVEGFPLLGEAENGEQALSLIRREQPDIVITDMKMPVLDGVSLIRRLQKLPYIPVVVALSSYDDYELVRESMRLGAVDYILKMDLSAEKLLQVLHSLRKEPSDNHDAVYVDALRAHLMKNIISRFFLSDEDLWQQMQQAEVSFLGENVWCLALKADISMEHAECEEEYQTIRLSLINIVEEIAQDDMDAFCAEGFTGEFYILGTVRNTEQSEEIQIHQTAERLAKMLELYLDLAVSVGISRGTKTVQGLFTACRQARLAARLATLEGRSVAVFEQNACTLPDAGAAHHYTVLNYMPELDHAILMGNTDMIHDIMKQIHISVCAPHTPAVRYQMAVDLLIHIRESLQRHGLENDIPAVTDQQRFNELAHIRNVSGFANWLDILEATLCDGLSEAGRHRSSLEVQHAQQFIDAHYAEELTLPALAEQLHLTPGYLSTLMKRELGMTFSEYVLHVRMEHAKELLEQENLRIYEVAIRVGYSNQYYFNKLFKRTYGISPGQYSRRMNRGEETQ